MTDHTSISAEEAADRLAIRELVALRYQDIFVKADGTWRFAERRLYVRWTETRTLEAERIV
jgi:hypothetical protein